jgi:hypothetical protein
MFSQGEGPNQVPGAASNVQKGSSTKLSHTILYHQITKVTKVAL